MLPGFGITEAVTGLYELDPIAEGITRVDSLEADIVPYYRMAGRGQATH